MLTFTIKNRSYCTIKITIIITYILYYVIKLDRSTSLMLRLNVFRVLSQSS